MSRARNYESVFRFRQDPSIPILLMRLQQGNNGLDLSCATHIIVMEPVLSASSAARVRNHLAVEAQAVSRVKRIGQRFESDVHYVIVDGTIESRMYGNARVCFLALSCLSEERRRREIVADTESRRTRA